MLSSQTTSAEVVDLARGALGVAVDELEGLGAEEWALTAGCGELVVGCSFGFLRGGGRRSACGSGCAG